MIKLDWENLYRYLKWTFLVCVCACVCACTCVCVCVHAHVCAFFISMHLSMFMYINGESIDMFMHHICNLWGHPDVGIWVSVLPVFVLG